MLDVIVEHVFLFDSSFRGRRDFFVFLSFECVANVEETVVRRDRRRLFTNHLGAIVLSRIMRSGNDDAARVIGRADGEIEHIRRNAADIHNLHARVYKA